MSNYLPLYYDKSTNEVIANQSSTNRYDYTTDIEIGRGAGLTGQQGCAIAIGFQAGMVNQGEEAIAIGCQAGMFNQAKYSIILNASGEPLNAGTTGFFVAPMRYIPGMTGGGGTQGFQGLGEDGLQGLMGIQGNQGLQGLGFIGTQGLQGVRGDAGGFTRLVNILDNVESGFAVGTIVANWTRNFTTFGGVVMFQGSLVASPQSSSGIYSVDMLIDGVVAATTTLYFYANLRMTFPCYFNVENLAAGTHLFQLRLGAALQVNVDRATVSFIEVIGGNTVGLVGPQGAIGFGLQGLQGIIGTQGRQGFQGLGLLGLQGIMGIQGIIGTQGIQGIQGIDAYGLQGLQGIMGGFIQMTQLLENVVASSSIVLSPNLVPNWVANFTSNGGTFTFQGSFSAFVQASNLLATFQLLIDSVVVSTSRYFFNLASVSETIPSYFVVKNIPAGNHTIQIKLLSNAVVDNNCFCNLSYIEVVGANTIGIQGPIGLQGFQGIVGFQGIQGSIGIGSQGILGLQGPWVSQGYVCPILSYFNETPVNVGIGTINVVWQTLEVSNSFGDVGLDFNGTDTFTNISGSVLNLNVCAYITTSQGGLSNNRIGWIQINGDSNKYYGFNTWRTNDGPNPGTTELPVIPITADIILQPSDNFVIRFYTQDAITINTKGNVPGVALPTNPGSRLQITALKTMIGFQGATGPEGGPIGPQGFQGVPYSSPVLSYVSNTLQAITANVVANVLWQTLDTTNSIGSLGLTYNNGEFTNNSGIVIIVGITASIISDAGSAYYARRGWASINNSTTRYGLDVYYSIGGTDTPIIQVSTTLVLQNGDFFSIQYLSDQNININQTIPTGSRIQLVGFKTS